MNAEDIRLRRQVVEDEIRRKLLELQRDTGAYVTEAEADVIDAGTPEDPDRTEIGRFRVTLAL